ncbi:unnamed protein product [Owenia fusiformis]|uniref:LicD/FKTN/FKRP nucleotidyltransferase domain-containing protein n=1 Tax=Owenia fusiformis TaxID=6347 RepID=A0A8J1TZK0_OWEFU|nr:unnamed protein product [Owenia fusiformis]
MKTLQRSIAIFVIFNSMLLSYYFFFVSHRMVKRTPNITNNDRILLNGTGNAKQEKYSMDLTKSLERSRFRNATFTREKNNVLHPLFITNCSLLPRRVPDSMFSDLYEILAELDRAFKKYNVTYVLKGGSLLGSYLFHDIIPWDDDIDINTDQRDYERQMLAFQELVETGRYGVHSMTDGRNIYKEFQCGIQRRNFSAWREIWNNGDTSLFLQAKFYKCSSPPARKPFQWRLPFIDIYPFVNNGTHVWERKLLKEFISINDFYPIHKRPISRGWYPSIKNPVSLFKARYGVKKFQCEYYWYNHMEEKLTKDRKKVKCSDIANSCYPTVKRSRHGEGAIETLIYRNVSLHSVFIPEILDKDHVEPLSYI